MSGAESPGRGARRWRRFQDLVRAVRLRRRAFDPLLRYSPAQLRVYQDACWRRVARLAAVRAPFYRSLYRGIDLECAPLTALPPVDKGELMAHFDAAVTVPALQLERIEAHLRTAAADETFLGRFHVLVTSGTSGERGLVVYDRDEWLSALAAALHGQALQGQRLRLLPRQRLASFTSTHPHHISWRLLHANDVGLVRWLAIDPQLALDEALIRLQRFRPEVLFGYPSVITPLAQAQLDGRLRLHPRRVIAGGEAVTAMFRDTVRSAWGCAVADLYATTETGALAVESLQAQERYLLEGSTLVEVVDEHDRPLPDGECGHHLLITCLQRSAQPLIRYRLFDRLVVAAPRGPGAPPYRCVQAIEGRVRDALRLRHRHGHEVEIRPAFLLQGLLALPGLRQVQVVQERDEIRVAVVAAEAQRGSAPAAVAGWFQALAGAQDLQLPRLVVTVVPRLGGTAGTLGKFRPVECRLPR